MHRLIAVAALCAMFTISPSRAQQLPPPSTPALMAVSTDEISVRLEHAELRVDMGAGVARTTIDLTFRNPNRRVLEGNLQFPLQPGQQIVGFALDVDGRMRDAVPVEKSRGREVFEQIAREGADPGLLEQTEGDFFRLRIYPFPAGGTRKVRLVLLEPLTRDAAGASATLSLEFARDLPAIDLAIRSDTPPRIDGLLRMRTAKPEGGGLHRLHLERSAYSPRRGITLHVAHAGSPAIQTQSHDGDIYFLAELPVDQASIPRKLPARMLLVWDSSTSGAKRAHELEYALLDAYFRAAGNVEVRLLRLRDVAESQETYHVLQGDWQGLKRALVSTVYDGATATGGWTPNPHEEDVLLFSDGLFNYGNAPFPVFAADQRLFAVKAGTAGDSARLSALASSRSGRAIELRDSSDLPEATAALLQIEPRLVSMQAIGAADLVAESPVREYGFLRIAGRMTEAHAQVTLRIDRNGEATPLVVDIRGDGGGTLAAGQWARYNLASLQAEPQRNRTAIESLGRRFRLVTPHTSLIVLENAADYVRFDITPPAELASEVTRLKAEQTTERSKSRQSRLDAAADAWAERLAWWASPFPKDRPMQVAETPADERLVAPSPSPASAAPPPMRDVADAAASSTELDRIEVTGARISEADLEESAEAAPSATNASIHLQAWQSDSPEARRLRQADRPSVYAVYLDERMRAPQSTAFYLDAADILLQKQQKPLALRVLSNLSELELDNPHILRVLGYRLLEADHADLAVSVFERVLEMSGKEPQSYRDLALALAATGNRQRAIELLYEIVQGDWDDRFAEIDQTALAELNAIVDASPRPLDTRFIDRRLLRNLPLDLRVVLTWDSNDSDMDLWVTDPNGEKAYYSNQLTYQGGRMSDDFTDGYGPEEFALRTAKPGVYKIEANFYGDRQQLVTGATTLQLWLSTGFGTPRQQDKRITVRLQGEKETVLVGEFEVK